MAGKNGKETFSDGERAGLTPEELAVLDDDTTDADALRAIAGEMGGETDPDHDPDEEEEEEGEEADAEAKAAAKAAAEEKARADAEAKAQAEAEAKAKAEADAKVKEAADAAAEAAKKAGADEAAQAKAREDAEAAARAALEGAATPDGEGEDDDGEDLFVPVYSVDPPERYDERMAEFDTRYQQAIDDQQADKISVAEMVAEHRKIESERRGLELEKFRYDTAVEQAEQAQEQRWHWEINRFMRDTAKHEGIDYRIKLNEDALEEARKGGDKDAIEAAEKKARSARILNGAFDSEVKALANDPANNGKTGDWFLREAHKRVKAALNLGKPAAKTPTPPAGGKPAKAGADRQPPVDKLPKTLGGLPQAGGVDLGQDGESEFAEINAIMAKDPLAAEAYIAGKSADWQDRWARHNG